MSLQGGPWIWTASLRYLYTVLILGAWIAVRHGPAILGDILRQFRANWEFWTFTGTIGVGIFYGSVCFASTHAPAWIIASTWQFTIVAGVLIFPLFGKPIPRRALYTSLLIFAGLLLVDLSSRRDGEIENIFLAVIPMFVAAFAYPIGNQIVGEAKSSGTGPGWIPRAWIPRTGVPVLQLASARVLLMSLGSMPFWLSALAIVRPAAPSVGQLAQTAAVALCAGVIGTSLFLHARHEALSPVEIAAVDATQAAEIVFALLMEMAFLGGRLPGGVGMIGLGLVLVGLVAYSRTQSSSGITAGTSRAAIPEYTQAS